ncbi:hypothetical protein GWI33_006846 [Rhynchophorus ferrugineus]|uniref:Juvenile hormone esterase binding protein n=1 Tax=Rhynchophorus ferrugineus TaxID=354439 RepID=A0A834IL23_RHYFE|nr:hypothetical protein GWI33_006846 [Rhynchophorus ferrugineus]
MLVTVNEILINSISAEQRTSYATKQGILYNETFKRRYSDKNPHNNKIPPLMTFPHLIWPSTFNVFQSFLLTTFIIKPFYDAEFKIADFVKGSKKALEVISHKLSDGDVNSLEGLVTSDVIPKLQSTVKLLTLTQRELLSVNAEDIYFAFPYQIGMIFKDEDKENQKRFVEITMVFHTLKGLADMRKAGEEIPINAGMIPQYQSKMFICNYRFIKEFTKGVESDWTVNLLNHFQQGDDEGWDV